jgi:hypothetical protein
VLGETPLIDWKLKPFKRCGERYRVVNGETLMGNYIFFLPLIEIFKIRYGNIFLFIYIFAIL